METIEIISTAKCNADTREGCYEVMVTVGGVSTYYSKEFFDTTANRCVIQGMIDAAKNLDGPCDIRFVSLTKIGKKKRSPNSDIFAELLQILESKGHSYIFDVVTGKSGEIKDKIRCAQGFSKKVAPASVKKEIDDYSYSCFHKPEMSRKQWAVYVLNPIDFGWNMLSTTSDVRALIGKEEDESDNAEYGWDLAYTRAQFDKDWDEALDLAKKNGMSSEIRNEPCVMWLPYEMTMEYGFVFKEESNGTTYVVSPVRLPWLEAYCINAQFGEHRLNGSYKQIAWAEKIISDALASYVKAAEDLPDRRADFEELGEKLILVQDCGWIIAKRHLLPMDVKSGMPEEFIAKRLACHPLLIQN